MHSCWEDFQLPFEASEQNPLPAHEALTCSTLPSAAHIHRSQCKCIEHNFVHWPFVCPCQTVLHRVAGSCGTLSLKVGRHSVDSSIVWIPDPFLIPFYLWHIPSKCKDELFLLWFYNLPAFPYPQSWHRKTFRQITVHILNPSRSSVLEDEEWSGSITSVLLLSTAVQTAKGTSSRHCCRGDWGLLNALIMPTQVLWFSSIVQVHTWVSCSLMPSLPADRDKPLLLSRPAFVCNGEGDRTDAFNSRRPMSKILTRHYFRQTSFQPLNFQDFSGRLFCVAKWNKGLSRDRCLDTWIGGDAGTDLSPTNS